MLSSSCQHLNSSDDLQARRFRGNKRFQLLPRCILEFLSVPFDSFLRSFYTRCRIAVGVTFLHEARNRVHRPIVDPGHNDQCLVESIVFLYELFTVRTHISSVDGAWLESVKLNIFYHLNSYKATNSPAQRSSQKRTHDNTHRSQSAPVLSTHSCCYALRQKQPFLQAILKNISSNLNHHAVL